MERIKLLLFMLLLSICFLVTNGCQSMGTPSSGVEVPIAKIKPCQVSVPMMENIFTGQESISLAPYFTISNPNDFPVTLSELRYNIYLMNKTFLCDGKTLPLNYIIPANGQITVTSAFAVTWVNLSMWIWSTQGKDMSQAINEILPLWKGLNGGLFNPKLKDSWDKTPEKPPVFDVTGGIDILGPKGQAMTSDYSTTWTLSGEYKIYK
jgi:LEA14-like dessication related protein